MDNTESAVRQKSAENTESTKCSRYPSTAQKVIMTTALMMLVLITIAGSILSGIMLYSRYYTNYKNELIDEFRTSLTEQKTKNVLVEYISVKNGYMGEFDCSQDYKGRTNFRYSIENKTTGEIFGNYVGGTEYSASYEFELSDSDQSYTIHGYLLKDRTELRWNEMYNLGDNLIELSYSLRYVIPLAAVIAFIFSVFFYCRLIRAAGHINESNTVQARLFDKLPFDLILIVFIFAVPFLVSAAFDYDYGAVNMLRKLTYSLFGDFIFLTAMLYGIFVLFYIATKTLAVRIKLGTLWKNTVIFRCLSALWKSLKFIWQHIRSFSIKLFSALPVVWRTLVIMLLVIGYTIITFLVTIVSQASVFIKMLFALSWICVMCSVIVFVVYSAWAIHQINKSMSEIAAGNIGYKTDLSKLHFVYLETGKWLNSLGNGLEAAVQAQIKSEHFKTELITNVSHDIKTPLTSIINYSDLLIAEQPGGKIGEYAEVIYRQSCRLKKLTEDLLEASKASSGSITVEMERIELNQMLSQAVGEYEERLICAGIKPVLRLTDDDIFVMADGKLLWRVFDNLLSNIVKYSLEGSRVYINLIAHDENAVIAFRNISRDTLELDTSELTERFVRGDSSRHSEGSGLGLGIALSLCELMHGRLELDSDGDLFKANVILPLSK